MAKIKKAQEGRYVTLSDKPEETLKTRQYKRLGRIAAKNPARAKKVAGRMTERATREARGKDYMSANMKKLVPKTPVLKKGGSMKKAKGSTSMKKCKYGCK